MTPAEKYPENIPWDLTTNGQSNFKSIQWMLTKGSNIYTFSRSRIDNQYVYIQRNRESKKAVKEGFLPRTTFEELFIKKTSTSLKEKSKRLYK